MNELSQAIVTLSDARAQGLTRYFTGKPCKYGHISERKVGTCGCVECHRSHDQKAYTANPVKKIAKIGQQRVRKAGTSTELTPHQQHQVNQIYLLMRSLTLATGIQHHVDHYIPVTKGGSHAPENLWVIPAEQNRRKGATLPSGNS